eukprot:scaffold5787_cov157-Amphora_coffeaeformis.AAC.7
MATIVFSSSSFAPSSYGLCSTPRGRLGYLHGWSSSEPSRWRMAKDSKVEIVAGMVALFGRGNTVGFIAEQSFEYKYYYW